MTASPSEFLKYVLPNNTKNKIKIILICLSLMYLALSSASQENMWKRRAKRDPGKHLHIHVYNQIYFSECLDTFKF